MITAPDDEKREVHKKYCGLFHKERKDWSSKNFVFLIETEQENNIKNIYSFLFSEKLLKMETIDSLLPIRPALPT